MANMNPSEAATMLVQRVQEDPGFKERVLDNPIGVMGELGIDRDLAWELVTQAFAGQGQEAEVQGHDWCTGWLTARTCQCTGFLVGCARRSAIRGAGCTTQKCG